MKPSTDRYLRQVIFPGIGQAGQAKLAKSTVVVIGCGALGTVAATCLARAGIGRLRIVDRDFIECHNLQRQILFDEDDVRNQIPKAVAAERHLRKVNSSIEIEGIVADVNYRNIERLVGDGDLILDGVDNLETRYLINDVSLKLRIPWVYGAAVASEGMTMNIIPGRTPCIRCLFPSMPASGRIPTCDTAGVINSAPFIIGALQSVEAIKILVGAEEVNKGLIIIDVWTGAFNRLQIADSPSPNCPACQGKYEFLDARFGARTTSLCGQNAVQVLVAGDTRLSFEELAKRFQKIGEVSYNEFILRFTIDGYEMVLFPDGRVIVKGTNDESLAKGLYAKYVGM
ncbi:MAG: ThiF family adenylyltransferase [Dehalococcoidia bacterium]